MAKKMGTRKTGISITLTISLLFELGRLHEDEPDKSFSELLESLLGEALKARRKGVAA